MPFRIVWHEKDTILEVVYPAVPTVQDVEDYSRAVRGRIDMIRGRPWACLVDQRAVGAMPPEVVQVIADLNAWAQKRNMRRTARVVTSAVARLQSTRLVREAMLHTEFRVFESREDALTWLRASDPSSTPPAQRR